MPTLRTTCGAAIGERARIECETRNWMAKEWARTAGSATSPAKAAASRVNGTKGGRPRKRTG